MQKSIPTVAPRVLHERLVNGHQENLVDVRSAVEFEDKHAQGAVSIPLDQLDIPTLRSRLGSGIGDSQTLHLICTSGIRAEQAARQLAAGGMRNVAVVTGGTDAWSSQALPTARTNKAISLARQTQIALGVLIVIMLAKGMLLHPVFYGAIGLLGIGLVMSGITARCGLEALLVRMPWNRGSAGKPLMQTSAESLH